MDRLDPASLDGGRLHRDFARSLERAGFDYLILEDSAYVPDGYGSSPDYYLKNAMHVPKHDPAVLGSILTQYTKRLGIVVTLSVTEYAPYMLARQMATLDHMSCTAVPPPTFDL